MAGSQPLRGVKPPAKRQLIAKAIAAAIKANGYPPTVRELAEAIGASPSCVVQHLDVMRACGDVDWKDGCGRTLRLLPRAAE